MKKALTILVSVLVAVSFAGVVMAAEPVAMPAGHPPVAEKKEVKKEKKAAKKAKKSAKKAEEKSGATPATPATPAAPAAK